MVQRASSPSPRQQRTAAYRVLMLLLSLSRSSFLPLLFLLTRCLPLFPLGEPFRYLSLLSIRSLAALIQAGRLLFIPFFIYSSSQPVIAAPRQRLLRTSASCAHTHTHTHERAHDMHACSAAIIKKKYAQADGAFRNGEGKHSVARRGCCLIGVLQRLVSQSGALCSPWRFSSSSEGPQHHAGGSYCRDTRCTRGNTPPLHPSSSCSTRIPPSRCMLGNVVDSAHLEEILCGSFESSFGKIYNLWSIFLFTVFNMKGLTVTWYNVQVSDHSYYSIILTYNHNCNYILLCYF